MGIMILIVGGFIFMIAATAVMDSYDYEGCVPTLIFGAVVIGAAYAFWPSDDKPKEQAPTEQTDKTLVECKPGTGVDMDKDGKAMCYEGDGDADAKETPKEEPPKEEAPPPKEEEKKNVVDGVDFDAWSQDTVSSASLVCDRSGNQIYVSAWLYTEGDRKGQPNAFSAWPKLRDNGQPFKCKDGKPTDEQSPPADEGRY